MNLPGALIIAVMALTALVVPFLRPAMESLFSEKDFLLFAGPRSFRSVAGALFLLSLFAIVIYSVIAENAPERNWFVFWGMPFVLIFLVVILPDGRLRQGIVRLVEYSLVAVGVGLVAGNLIHLWIAASDGRAIFPSRGPRKFWVNGQEEPLWFWLSVVSSALTLWLATAVLRGYFSRVFMRR